MNTRIFILFSALVCLVLTSCEHDNFAEPNAFLTGKVVYNGNPVGVRTNGPQLELWQPGYQLFSKVVVHIAHDGTFSTAVFDGNYKLVRLSGAPWQNQTDTIDVVIKGNTVVDVPVTPYYIVRNESFQKGTNSITAKFVIDKVSQLANNNVAAVTLYLGKLILTDQNRNESNASLALGDLTIGSEATITANIPASLQNEDYIFARVGVRSSLSNEFYYSQVQKVQLK
jgi:hypothetical protein